MENINILESQLRQIFATVAWTHKIQEKQCDLYIIRSRRLEFLRILASAITSSGVFAVIFIDGMWLKLLTALISAVSLFITTYFKTYDLNQLHAQHKEAALNFLELREEITSILCDIKVERYTYYELLQKRDEILEKKIRYSKNTPDATEKAVKLASKALKVREDNTFSDYEIDSFLPKEARKNK